MAERLREKALSGIVWTGGERLLCEIVHFLLGLALARLLTPSDYGVIGMLSIFMAISSAFLDSGFSSALIQKKDRTETDYSTAFYFNTVVALIFYLALFVFAPWIAAFYRMPVLTNVTRVISLSLILNGLTIVQTAKLTVALDFRSQAIASFVSLLVAGGLGIALAWLGYGVWALVWQGVALTGMRAAILWRFSHWIPMRVFSRDSFRSLFSFGSKILFSGMINTVYSNIYPLVIGRFFGASDLGFFNRANQFASLPANTVTDVVIKVNYPILVEVRDDRGKLLRAYRKLTRAPLFLLIPVLFGMSAVARPIVLVLLGEQWAPCIPLLQILCIGAVCTPLTHVNLNLLYVKGRSDLVLKLELIKKPIAFAILVLSLFFPVLLDSCIPGLQQRYLFSWIDLGPVPVGVFWMAIGWVLYDIIAFLLNCHYTKKLLDYGVLAQLREILPLFARSIAMVVVVRLLDDLWGAAHWRLLGGICTGALTYFALALLGRDETLGELLGKIVCWLKARKGRN